MTRRILAVLLVLIAVFAISPKLGQTQNGKGDMINQSYQIAFCRMPGDYEFRYWMAQNDGRVANLQSLLAAHRWWIQRQPDAERFKVTRSAYLQTLGREPNGQELASWNQALAAGNTNCADIQNAIRRR